jgi:exonuclease VII small subunit
MGGIYGPVAHVAATQQETIRQDLLVQGGEHLGRAKDDFADGQALIKEGQASIEQSQHEDDDEDGFLQFTDSLFGQQEIAQGQQELAAARQELAAAREDFVEAGQDPAWIEQELASSGMSSPHQLHFIAGVKLL